ncbi:MAG TPA: arginine--tRNA ligase [Terriglobales bacterium]|nr:arginine--tRNA ligase [Terriglobales bacterium]
MYRQFQKRLEEAVRAYLHRQYELDLTTIAVEQPPNVSFGEFALPLAFELAKKLRKAPRKIAEEIVAGIGPIPGFERLEVAGAGYINARVQRAAMAAGLAADAAELSPIEAEHHAQQKILMEHTSINPNKAAHIGHLRNAILGDTFVRLLQANGYPVDVQNYIDNTGVQVADVVVGFVQLEKKAQADIEKLIDTDPRFDYTCWDLYARVSQWYAEGGKNVEARLDALHKIEQGGNELAEIARMISETIVAKHLDTMLRLGIVYDFLPQESEILHLKFWEVAFQQLKDKGVLKYVEEGKNKGCWVMVRGGVEKKQTTEDAKSAEEDQKVIVRSNGTVTYVGKDIAYHLWKFGLLGQDFGYRRFYIYPDGHECWISTDHLQNEPDHPHFGGVQAIYNVIDTRQTDPQTNVVEAIRALGYSAQADHYTHFSYEMVALTPRCALELGYDIDEEDRGRAYIEVSGRKGFGVKADDLIDALIAAAKKEVDPRHPELSDDERLAVAMQIAIGALRYFMLRFTKNSVIAFDFKDALAFEGETGPYAQYAVVRASNIFRKAGLDPEKFLAETQLAASLFERYFTGDSGDELWELWLASSKLPYVIEQCIATTEPAYLAKYAFQLAQLFNNFYHRHHILGEEDEAKKKFLLATAGVVRRELMRALEVMGITVPPVM